MTTSLVLAEVMDKELTLPGIWVYFLTIGAFGFFVGRHCPVWCSSLPVSLVGLCAYVQLVELHDPYVGPAILAETGLGYVIQSYLAIGFGIGLPAAGIALRQRAGRPTSDAIPAWVVDSRGSGDR